MKMKKLLILGGVMAAISSPASAHTGDHTAPSLLANLFHWLSSPNHALLSLVGVAIVAFAITAMRKRRS